MKPSMRSASRIPTLKPPALRPGDTIGIVAPASNIQRPLLEAGCATLQEMGYRPSYSETIFDQDLYFAGTLERRVRELEEMFERDDVHAIVCARGGYGSNYLLREIDIELVQKHPKIFMGYSDITSLLTWFTDATGLVTFHGPMVTKDFHPEGFHAASLHNALSAGSQWELQFSGEGSVKVLLEVARRG